MSYCKLSLFEFCAMAGKTQLGLTSFAFITLFWGADKNGKYRLLQRQIRSY